MDSVYWWSAGTGWTLNGHPLTGAYSTGTDYPFYRWYDEPKYVDHETSAYELRLKHRASRSGWTEFMASPVKSVIARVHGLPRIRDMLGSRNIGCWNYRKQEGR